MKQITKYMSFFCLILGLSGCSLRVVDWAQQCYTPAKEYQGINKDARAYVRSIAIYDEIATAGMFDALWLSDSVRAAYTDHYGARRGKNAEFKHTFLRRQIEENKHFISFYVLSSFDNKLHDAKAQWMVYLVVDGVAVQPLEAKTVDLEPEYQAIFGDQYTRFKEAYLVKFDAKDADERPILTQNSKVVELVFRSLDKETSLRWEIANLPNIMPAVSQQAPQAPSPSPKK